jgi:hypothetical protein
MSRLVEHLESVTHLIQSIASTTPAGATGTTVISTGVGIGNGSGAYEDREDEIQQYSGDYTNTTTTTAAAAAAATAAAVAVAYPRVTTQPTWSYSSVVGDSSNSNSGRNSGRAEYTGDAGHDSAIATAGSALLSLCRT